MTDALPKEPTTVFYVIEQGYSPEDGLDFHKIVPATPEDITDEMAQRLINEWWGWSGDADDVTSCRAALQAVFRGD